MLEVEPCEHLNSTRAFGSPGRDRLMHEHPRNPLPLTIRIHRQIFQVTHPIRVISAPQDKPRNTATSIGNAASLGGRFDNTR